MRVPSNGGNGGKRGNFESFSFKKGKNTCLVCGRTEDWKCRVREDEGLGLCSYIPSDKKDIKGRYIHILRDGSAEKPKTPKKTIVEDSNQVVKADADRLDAVYLALLKKLELTENHSNDLLYRRGLGDTNIAKNLYASVPQYGHRFDIAEELSESFNLESVPGFFLDGNRWCLGMTFPGFYVPYRDEKGRIIGLQIRRDKYESERDKYMWLSSDGKDKGASSGSPLHFIKPDIVKESRTVFLTEGALKADVISVFSDIGLVATAGVSVVPAEKLLDSVNEVFPDLERVVLAYDMDWETNKYVHLGISRLLDALKVRNVRVDVATWDRNLGKGLDDVLFNENAEEGAVKYTSADEFRDILASVVFKEELKDETEESTVEVFTEEPVEVKSQQEDFEDGLESEDIVVNQDYEREENDILYSWGELSKLDFENAERVVFGLMRGNMGMMVASTNIGKTTLALNLALSATAGKDFYPLLNQNHTARKILYIDGEATKAELQSDVKKMLEPLTAGEVESVHKNLFLICDEELDGEPLDLVNESHFELVKQKALYCQPDLIIVDTLSALMDIEDENDNAKVKKEVMKPLKKLAKLTNSAVLLLHHTGKFNESFSPVGAYKGRGASAFGALSRIVLTLEKSKYGKNAVVLSCPKSKGDKFDNTVLELDLNSRWFTVVGNDTSKKKLSNYEKVVEFVVNFGKPVKREEVVDALEGIMSSQTVDRQLKYAVEAKRLDNPEYGFYSAPKNIESELPLKE